MLLGSLTASSRRTRDEAPNNSLLPIHLLTHSLRFLLSISTQASCTLILNTRVETLRLILADYNFTTGYIRDVLPAPFDRSSSSWHQRGFTICSKPAPSDRDFSVLRSNDTKWNRLMQSCYSSLTIPSS